MAFQELLWGYDDPFLERVARLAPDMTDGRFRGLQTNYTTPDMARAHIGPEVVYAGVSDAIRNREVLQCGTACHPCSAAGKASASQTVSGCVNHTRLVVQWTVFVLLSVPQKYEGRWVDMAVQGINTLRFIIPDWVLCNATLNPTNAAYNITEASGVYNITGCSGRSPVCEGTVIASDIWPAESECARMTAVRPHIHSAVSFTGHLVAPRLPCPPSYLLLPSCRPSYPLHPCIDQLLMTKPRFLQVSPSLADRVVYIDGPPTLRLHDTVINVQPTAGIPIRANERLQASSLTPDPAKKAIANVFCDL